MTETPSEPKIGLPVIDRDLTASVAEKLNQKEASARVFAVFDFRRFHPGSTIKEAAEFVDTHMRGETPYGYPIWDTPDNAAKFMGGIDAVDENNAYYIHQKGCDPIPTTQYSVRWTPADENGEGWRGGIGGV